MKDSEIRELVDHYVSIDEEIKKLEKKRDKMKEQIIALGEGAHRSNLGSVSVTLSQRNVFKVVTIPAQHFKTSSSITVRVTKFEGDEE